MDFSKDFKKKIIDALTSKNSNMQVGSAKYLALSFTDPRTTTTDSNNYTVPTEAIVEPSTQSGYKRALLGYNGQSFAQKMTVAATTLHAVTTSGTTVNHGVIGSTNTDIVYFSESTGAWTYTPAGGTQITAINYYAIYDAETGGNLLAYGKLSAPVTISAAQQVPLIRLGDLQIAFDNEAPD